MSYFFGGGGGGGGFPFGGGSGFGKCIRRLLLIKLPTNINFRKIRANFS